VLIGRLSRDKACMYLWSHARLRPSLLVERHTRGHNYGDRKLNAAIQPTFGMDVGEVVRRVGLAYWPLILGLAFVGAAGAGAVHFKDAPIYTSEVRFVLDTSDPRAASESVAIADTAKSIATSPANVSAALLSAGVDRDVEQFATRNVDLQPLGTSGVMDLQVKDSDPVAAASIANALAIDVISTRLRVNELQAVQLATSLTDQVKALDASIAQLDARIANYRSSSPDPSTSAAALSGLYSERASLAQERLTLEAEINQINQSLALRPQALIIDAAVPASAPDPSRAPIDMALGGLGGLVLAVILATLLATLRPRISGTRQIERLLAAPVLGNVNRLDDEVDATLPARVGIAAMRLGVKHIQLVPLDGSVEAVNVVNVLADRLGSRPAAASVPVPLYGNGQAVTHPRRRSPNHHLDVTPFDPALFMKNGNATETGVILVTPAVLGKGVIEASTDLRSLTGWPVAGVVTYGRKLGRSWELETYGRRSPARARHADVDNRFTPSGYL